MTEMTITSSSAPLDDLLKQADALLHERCFDKAAEIYKQCSILDSTDPRSGFGLGLCHKGRGQIQEALHCFSQVLTLAPVFRPNVLELAELLLERNAYAQAIRLLTFYLQHAPEDLKVCHLLIKAQQCLLEHSGASVQSAATSNDLVVKRLHDILKILLANKKLKLDTLIYNDFGGLSYGLMLLPRVKAAGYIKDEIFLCGRVPNQQLLEMLKREINVVQDDQLGSVLPVEYDWIKSEYTLKEHEFAEKFLGRHHALFQDVFSFTHSSNGKSYYPAEQSSKIVQHPFKPKFTDEEEARGRAFLRDKLGVPDNAPFVCVYARDAGYYNETAASPKFFRNSDILSYHKALRFLIDQGCYVIRVGSDVKTSLGLDHPHAVDYALRGRTDFMDIYLLVKCRFFMGTPGGLQVIPWTFGVPLLNVDTANLNNGGNGVIFIPKKIRSTKDGRYVTFKEFVNRFYTLPNYQEFWEDGPRQQSELGYVYEGCTEQELFEGAVEMWQRLNHTFVESETDRKLLEQYRALWPRDNVMFVSSTPPATTYLRRNQHLFFGDS